MSDQPLYLRLRLLTSVHTSDRCYNCKASVWYIFLVIFADMMLSVILHASTGTGAAIHLLYHMLLAVCMY